MLDNSISQLLALTVGICLIAATALRRPGNPARRVSIPLLRAAAIASVTVIAVDPFTITRDPKPEAFYIALVADVSGSMTTADGPDGLTRLQATMREVRSGNNRLADRLGDRYALQTLYLNSSVSAEFPGLEMGQGTTSLSRLLDTLPTRPSSGGRDLGGVLLLSDGRQTAPGDPVASARSLKESGLPISTVVVGRNNIADVDVSFTDAITRTTSGEPAILRANLRNHSGESRSVTLSLRSNGEELAPSQTVQLQPKSSTRASFTIELNRSGTHLVEVTVEAPGDVNRANNVASTVVEVEAPQTIIVLWMGKSISPELRQIRRALEDFEDLRLITAIEPPGGPLLLSGVESEEAYADLDEFIESSDAYENARVIVLPTADTGTLSSASLDALTRFVDQRGGGLLLFGTEAPVQNAIRELLPAKAFRQWTASQTTPVQFVAGPLFDPAETSDLFREPTPAIPPLASAATVAEKPLGAVEGATVEGQPVLTAQPFGAGRVAFLGLDTTWHWPLSGKRNQLRHERFWTRLCRWLAVGKLSRFEPQNNVQFATAGQATELAVELRNPDYSPALSGSVIARITSAASRPAEIELLPDPAEAGRFSARFQPDQPGLFEVSYRAELSHDDSLRGSSSVVVERAKEEFANLAADPATAAAIARITGGVTMSIEDVDRLDSIPVSQRIPLVEKREHWARTPHWLALTIALLAFEWWWRRRNGLR